MLHTQGFNPHPKLSLPLPRSVGIETDGDLFCLWVEGFCDDRPQVFDTEEFKRDMSVHLPQGCDLISVIAVKPGASIQPIEASYVFAVKRQYIGYELTERVRSILSSEKLIMKRQIDRNGRNHSVDVRGFIKSVDIAGSNVAVRCRISPAGSIRVDEIFKLLELDVSKLTLPVRRNDIKWSETWQ